MKWTRDNIGRAAKLRDEGLTSAQIGLKLGVTASSIRSVLSMSHQERSRAQANGGYLSPFYSGPAIERCRRQEGFNQNAIEGSALLRDAILRCAA